MLDKIKSAPPDPGWIPFLKIVFGVILLLLLAGLVAIIALGKVQKETSYGLDSLLTGVLLITQQWATWCFRTANPSRDKDGD